MNATSDFVLYDSLKKKISNGNYTGSIISKYDDKIIFSDNITISNSSEISISQGLIVGFKEHKLSVLIYVCRTEINK